MLLDVIENVFNNKSESSKVFILQFFFINLYVYLETGLNRSTSYNLHENQLELVSRS